jgi:hypothetical protein
MHLNPERFHMIRKIFFGFIWCIVLFSIIYTGCGVLYVFINKGGAVGDFHEAYQIGLEFRHEYFRIIGIGVISITIIGAVTGILPGIQKKTLAGKK